jgi:hypothetical protein
MISSSPYNQTHLVESERIELACDYLVHEFRKIFHNISHKEAHEVVLGRAPTKNSPDVIVRDFWNLFCSMSSTWRLKDLCHIVTAKNYLWKKCEIPLARLVPESPQGWMKEIRPPYDFGRALIYLRDKNNLENARKKSENFKAEHAEGDENDPIIARSESGNYIVTDGNRRLKLEIEGWVTRGETPDPTMTTWVGDGKGLPENYWMPTGSIFFLRGLCGSGIESILGKISPLALTEYNRRVKAPVE